MPPIGEHADPRQLSPRELADAASGSAANGDHGNPDAEPSTNAAAPRPELWWELLAVACIAVAPALCDSIAYRAFIWPEWSPRGYHATLVAHSLYVVIPLLFIARRAGMRWFELGFVRPRRLDFVVLPVLTILTAGTPRLVATGFACFGLFDDPAELLASDAETAARPTACAFDHVLGVVAHLANGFAEELAMRAYFVTRLRAATGSWTIAILGSTLAFTSYHTYDGFGLSCIFVMGILFTVGWLITRNLCVVALSHAMTNLWIEYF